jgi:gag-polyprotein putative aspartyl protease
MPPRFIWPSRDRILACQARKYHRNCVDIDLSLAPAVPASREQLAHAEAAHVAEHHRTDRFTIHTANGVVDGKRGHAATIELRSLRAKDVVIGVQSGGRGNYGQGVDGLLGLSFLSSFKVSIDTQTVKIANRNAK